MADDTSVFQNYKPDTGILIANENLKKVSDLKNLHLRLTRQKHTLLWLMDKK